MLWDIWNRVLCFMVIYYVHIPDPIIKLLVSVIQWSNIICIYQKITRKSSDKWLFLVLKFDLKSPPPLELKSPPPPPPQKNFEGGLGPPEYKRCAEAWTCVYVLILLLREYNVVYVLILSLREYNVVHVLIMLFKRSNIVPPDHLPQSMAQKKCSTIQYSFNKRKNVR